MNDHTRQDIINAYDALEELKNVALSTADFCGDTDKYLMWKNEILKVLPPKPQLTMADIEWDDAKHYLAEAEHPDYGKVIMLGLNSYSLIDFFAPKRYSSRFKDAPPEILTPTGKRYTLMEVQE